MRLSGNVVLITGGSSGIGLELAKAFIAAGSEAIICARGATRLNAALAETPGLHGKLCDVSNSQQRADLVDWVVERFPRLNVLVNNAGVQRDIDFTNGLGDYLSGDDEIEINLTGPICLSGLLIPHLRAQAAPAIVNISSGLAFAPMANMPVYCAAKAGLHAWSLALRRQLEPKGIKVFEVAPPGLDTDLNREGRAKRGGYKAGIGPAEFVASVMTDLQRDAFEIGYGSSAALLRASRDELDRVFDAINRRA